MRNARTQGARLGQKFQSLRFRVEHTAGDLEQLLAGLRQRHLFLVTVEKKHVVLSSSFRT